MKKVILPMTVKTYQNKLIINKNESSGWVLSITAMREDGRKIFDVIVSRKDIPRMIRALYQIYRDDLDG
jgi:hypothetical protein